MTLVRTALEASLTDLPFVEEEILPVLPQWTRPAAGAPIALRLMDMDDREEVTAELGTEQDSTLLLGAFAQDEAAEHTYRVLQALWDAGLDERSRYRVPQPVALMMDDCVVLSSKGPGVPLAELVDARAPEAIGMIKDAGSWLAQLHAADVRVGKSWFPWQSIEELAENLRARSRFLGAHRMSLRAMVHRLARLAGGTSIRRWAQTHGRFRPDRVQAGPGAVTVDDFVRSAPGDPARDVAEFIFHLRRRAVLGGDPRASVLAPAFLDGYLAEAPEEHLANVGFYAGCTILTSLVAKAPSDGLDAWVEFHIDEFDRSVSGETAALRPPA